MRQKMFFLAAFLMAICLVCSVNVFAGAAAETEETTTSEAGEGQGFHEAPMLRARVDAGELPPLDQRLPLEPMVMEPFKEIGMYGGTMELSGNVGWSFDGDMPSREMLFFWTADSKTVVPNIAKGWEFSTDAKTFTIYLREGLKWSDGAPFTADDLVFWYEDILMNDELNPTKPKQWTPGGEVMKLEKVDDYTVNLKFAVPHPLILYILTEQGKGATQQGGIIAPAHYLKKFHPKYVEADDLQKLVDEKSLDSWVRLFGTKTGIQGTGQDVDLPRLSAWIPVKTSTAGVTYERNAYYWKVDPAGNQLPYIDYRKVTVISESEIIKMKTMDGDINYAYIGGISEDLTLYMENRESGNYDVYEWQGTGNGRPAFCFNQNVRDDALLPIFRDKRFRQAMSLAITRDEINELQYLGMAEARQATLLSSSRFYEEEYARAFAEHDVDEANRLLDEVGLKWDSNNEWRLRPDGETMAVVLEIIDGHPIKPIELTKEYWEKVGVKVILKPYPVGTARNRIIAGEPEAFETYAQDTDLGFMLDGGIYASMFLADWMPAWRQWYNTDGAEGEEPIAEIKQLFEALETMTSTTNEDKRTQAGKEILRLHAENVWIIDTVGADPAFGVASKDLGNVPDESIMAGALAWAKFQRPEQMFFKK